LQPFGGWIKINYQKNQLFLELPIVKFLVLAPLLTFDCKFTRLGKLFLLQKILFNADLNLGLLFLFAISSLRCLWYYFSWLG
jgi:hypothetical protein